MAGLAGAGIKLCEVYRPQSPGVFRPVWPFRHFHTRPVSFACCNQCTFRHCIHSMSPVCRTTMYTPSYYCTVKVTAATGVSYTAQLTAACLCELHIEQDLSGVLSLLPLVLRGMFRLILSRIALANLSIEAGPLGCCCWVYPEAAVATPKGVDFCFFFS